MAKRRGKGGRPARTDSPQRLVTHIAGALKKRLQHRAIEEGCSAGAIIERALEAYLSARERGRA